MAFQCQINKIVHMTMHITFPDRIARFKEKMNL